MTVTVTMTFELDDDEYQEFLEGEEVQGNLHDWIFGEICQNHGFGFLTRLNVSKDNDDEDEKE